MQEFYQTLQFYEVISMLNVSLNKLNKMNGKLIWNICKHVQVKKKLTTAYLAGVHFSIIIIHYKQVKIRQFTNY